MLISQEKIDLARNRLVDAYNPLKIYLFGSYAWGQPNEHSDLDILVVIKEEAVATTAEVTKHRRCFSGYEALWGLKIPKDLIVLTEDEFEQLSKIDGSLVNTIKRAGKLLYAAS